jgi:hypothetical protein
MRWTPERAARLGYLAGRDVSMESALRDRRIGVKSRQALRHVAKLTPLDPPRIIKSSIPGGGVPLGRRAPVSSVSLLRRS